MIILFLFIAALFVAALVAVFLFGVRSINDVLNWPGVRPHTIAIGVTLRVLAIAAALAILLGTPLIGLGLAH